MNDEMKSLFKQIDDIRLEMNIQKNTYDLTLDLILIALNEISPKQNVQETLLKLLHESASSAMAIAPPNPGRGSIQAIEEVIGRVDAIIRKRQQSA
ncbi:hypothetical protein LSE82_005033 [Salmonella enterica]|nr:hypothetical protein [Salmonella enterica]